ncbi:carbohydrate ABC transporter permease [Cohnella suwonensis]|uniref:Carbohydrate ABC transporter permease n=1 Tax=Cohnella suwonensis TaxID=696072 RepID=A0ABW0M2Q5_9BACL
MNAIKSKKRWRHTFSTTNEVWVGWLLSAPALIVLLVFLILPFLMSVYYSMTNRMMIMPPNQALSFVGFTNYSRIFQSQDFFIALKNTMKFVLIATPVQSALALALAMLINSKKPFITLFRTVYFSPVVISMVVVSIVWSLLLRPDQHGFINALLHFVTFGYFEPKMWLFDPDTSMISIIMLSVWQGAGFQMVIFLAGLQNIPEELYEAGKIDGAGNIRRFFNITLPLLRNQLIFVMISTTILSFRLFTQIVSLTGGGPHKSTLTLVYLIYSEGFINMKIGYASAMSVIFLIIVLIISLIQMKLSKASQGDS